MAQISPSDNVFSAAVAAVVKRLNLGGSSGGVVTNLEFVAGWNSASAAVVANQTVPQDVIIPFACTLKEVVILTQGVAGASVSGSCTVSVGKAALASLPTSFADMTGGVSPAISSSTAPYDNTTLSGWTTALNANDVIRLTLTANTNFASVKISLKVG